MYTVWHVDKYKITFTLVINHWTNEILVTDICYTDVIYAFWVWAFRHIHEYYSPQNTSTIKYLFMKNDKFQENLSRIDVKARYCGLVCGLHKEK